MSILETTAVCLGLVQGIKKYAEPPHILSGLLLPLFCYPVTPKGLRKMGSGTGITSRVASTPEAGTQTRHSLRRYTSWVSYGI